MLQRWCRGQPDPKVPHRGIVGFDTLEGISRGLHQLPAN